MKQNVLNLSYITFILLIAISCKKETLPVSTTGVTLSHASLLINSGSRDTLKSSISPSNATNPDVTWISNDTTIAKVNSNGIVEGMAPGVTTITGTTVDGKYTATCVVNTIKWTTYTTNNGLADNHVVCITIDLVGNLWFGGSSASKFDGSSWTTYLNKKGVGAITVDAQGNKWFGTWGNGVFKFDDINWTTYDTSNCGLTDNTINTNAIAIDLQGSIWFGTSSRVTWKGTGVSKFDGTIWNTYKSSNGLVYDNVLSIEIDGQGNKWFATGKGVSKFDGINWTSYTSNNTNNNLVDIAYCIGIDAKENKWFGTTSGVLKFDGTNWTTYSISNSGIVSNAINAIAFDKKGNIWIATYGGVSKFDGTNWTTYNYNNGLTSNVVLSIAIDTHGNKWFGTVNGVFKLQD
jgi:Bacterial Ig-like domain (group 2)/Two component regulator propeller